MASTNSNKGRAVVLSAACVTMFFISSIALYSVVSKNLLAVYPEWSSALTWAFPVFQTIMAVTGIFAGRISDKIGPRNVVIAAAVCYGVGWFMSGTVTEPWQFYLWFSLVAAVGNGLGYNPALTTGQKWFIDKKGLASGITLAASTAGPAVLSPVLASLLIPSLGIFDALKALGVIFFVTIAASALFLKAPEAGWLPEGFEAPKGGAHAGTFGDLTPGEMVKTPRFWVLIVTFAFALVFAAILTREKIKGQNFFRIIFYIPNILSVVVISGIFSAIYKPENGMLNSIIGLFRNMSDPILWKGEKLVIPSIIIAMVWQAIGYYMVMYMASMSAVPISLYESANLDGAGRLTQFFQITIPLIWTNIRTTLTFFIISTINMAFLFVKAMTSGGPNGASDVALSYMYSQKDAGLYGYSMAIGVVIFLFSFALSACVNKVTNRDTLEF